MITRTLEKLCIHGGTRYSSSTESMSNFESLKTLTKYIPSQAPGIRKSVNAITFTWSKRKQMVYVFSLFAFHNRWMYNALNISLFYIATALCYLLVTLINVNSTSIFLSTLTTCGLFYFSNGPHTPWRSNDS